MALARVEYPSRTLRMQTSIQVVLPDDGDLGECPVVYLLHGCSDNCTGWTRYTSCERYARARGAALVLPEVQRSFYTDQVYGLDYFGYVSQELPQAMHRMFGLSLERSRSYVMGLSMGGYGALKCALTFPERYAGCGAFSAVTDLKAYRDMPERSLDVRELVALLGQEFEVEEKNDLFALAGKAAALPPVYMTCGEQDRFFDMNQRFARLLEDRGLPCSFLHRPGDHSWDFWDRSLRDCLDYFDL